jgi:phosphatidylglycerophosphatase A
MQRREPRDMSASQSPLMRPIVLFFATGAGSGYSPVAPGTAGSLVGLVLVWAVFEPIWRYSWPAALIIFAILFGAGCWIAGAAETIFAEHDSSRIVLDEVLGMVATMFLNPIGWRYLLAGFVIFRLFDIIKPPPASLIDREVGGGVGVMLDDLVAAVYANIALRALAHFI